MQQKPLQTAPKDGRRIRLVIREQIDYPRGRVRLIVGTWNPLTESWALPCHYPDTIWKPTPEGCWTSLDGTVMIVAWQDPNASEEETPDEDLFWWESEQDLAS